jgi:hypothetical protein
LKNKGINNWSSQPITYRLIRTHETVKLKVAAVGSTDFELVMCTLELSWFTNDRGLSTWLPMFPATTNIHVAMWQENSQTNGG